jgi:hypothetical protein
VGGLYLSYLSPPRQPAASLPTFPASSYPSTYLSTHPPATSLPTSPASAYLLTYLSTHPAAASLPTSARARASNGKVRLSAHVGAEDIAGAPPVPSPREGSHAVAVRTVEHDAARVGNTVEQRSQRAVDGFLVRPNLAVRGKGVLFEPPAEASWQITNRHVFMPVSATFTGGLRSRERVAVSQLDKAGRSKMSGLLSEEQRRIIPAIHMLS